MKYNGLQMLEFPENAYAFSLLLIPCIERGIYHISGVGEERKDLF